MIKVNKFVIHAGGQLAAKSGFAAAHKTDKKYLHSTNQVNFTRGSIQTYRKSTRILITTKIKVINRIEPITTGKSDISSASTVVLPNPLYPNTYSTKNDPACNEANQFAIAVITGFNAFFKACL